MYCLNVDACLCLQVGRMLQSTLVEATRQKCGYAAVADLATGQQRTVHLLVCHFDLYPPVCVMSAIYFLHVFADTTCLSLRCMNMVNSMCNLHDDTSCCVLCEGHANFKRQSMLHPQSH